MKASGLGLSALPLLLASPLAPAAEGSVCIGPLPFVTPGDKAAAGAKRPEFSVAIDQLEAVPVPRKESVRVRLPLGAPHEVTVRRNGKAKRRFEFTFENMHAHHLCLWFDPGVDAWSLAPQSEARGKCGCVDGEGGDARRDP